MVFKPLTRFYQALLNSYSSQVVSTSTTVTTTIIINNFTTINIAIIVKEEGAINIIVVIIIIFLEQDYNINFLFIYLNYLRLHKNCQYFFHIFSFHQMEVDLRPLIFQLLGCFFSFYHKHQEFSSIRNTFFLKIEKELDLYKNYLYQNHNPCCLIKDPMSLFYLAQIIIIS